jgi:class 3 adenylate cyclase
LLSLTALLLTFRSLAQQRLQALILAWIALSALVDWAVRTRWTPSGVSEGFYFPSVALHCVQVGIVYTLSRLRLRAAALGALISFLLTLHQDLWMYVPTENELGMGVGLLVFANLVGMIGGYFIEHSARRDFLLSRLLGQERERSERLLRSILPAPIAERLKEGPEVIADHYPEATVLFADLVDFTSLAAELPPQDVVALLNAIFTAFDGLARQHGLEKIKTVGDAYMAVAGVPEPRPDHAQTAAAMALGMRAAVARLSGERGLPLRLRIGMHSGAVVAGVIGKDKFSYDLWGDTVNVASRMESQGVPGGIQVSAATYALLREQYGFRERGLLQVKGRGEVRTYLLEH